MLDPGQRRQTVTSVNKMWPAVRTVSEKQGSKCPSLPGFTQWVNPGLPGLGFKPYFGKVGEYWGIKYFKCSELCKFVNIEASKTS